MNGSIFLCYLFDYNIYEPGITVSAVYWNRKLVEQGRDYKLFLNCDTLYLRNKHNIKII